jgi:hypothetical protein
MVGEVEMVGEGEDTRSGHSSIKNIENTNTETV